jgi:hypothetical protein
LNILSSLVVVLAVVAEAVAEVLAVIALQQISQFRLVVLTP